MNRDEHLPDEPQGEAEQQRALGVSFWLAQTLRRVRVPLSEMSAAHARVEASVFSHIPRGASRRAARRPKRRVGLTLTLSALCAAVWLSMMAATALPSSPLYAVKRGEEWIAYQTAWSDGRRSDVLLLAANRRLDEAQTLADEQEAAAVDLALDLRGNVMQLILLYQTVHVTRMASKETHHIKDGLVRMLTKESEAAEIAAASGKHLLADTLRENARLARDALASRHLALP